MIFVALPLTKILEFQVDKIPWDLLARGIFIAGFFQDSLKLM
jgi:hypothetical protein